MALVKQILVLIFISAHIILATCKNSPSAPSLPLVAGRTQLKDEKHGPKDKPSDSSELLFLDIMGMAPESPEEKNGDSKDKKKNDEEKDDSKDEKKDDSKDKKKKDEKKGDSNDEKKKDNKKDDKKDEKNKNEKKDDSKDDKKEKKDDSKEEKKKDEKKGDSKDEKKKDKKKGDSKDKKKHDETKGDSKDEKKGDSKDEKKDDSKDEKKKDEKKGDPKDEKKDDSKDEKGDSTDGKEGDVATEVTNQMHKIEKKISEFSASLKQRTDIPGSSPGSHECVLECDEVLGAATDDIKKTLDSLANQNLVKAKFDVSAVSTNVDTCNDCFDEMVGGDPEAKKLSDWVQKTTGNALEALKNAD